MSRSVGNQWMAGLVASARAVEHGIEGIGFVDLQTGELVSLNRSFRELLGLTEALPVGLETFVRDGRIARPDVDNLLDRARASGSRAAAWGMSVRFHRAPNDTVELDLRCAVARQITGDARALQIVAQRPERVAEVTRFTAPPTAPATFFDVYDEDMHIRFSDPRLEQYGMDPRRQVGTLSIVMVHPDDQSLAYDSLANLREGRATSAEYTLRIVGPLGDWVPITVHLVRMVGNDETLLVGTVRPLGHVRRPLPEEIFTERESQVVHALFGGWRVPALAVRDGVSTKTIRNQLSVIYKKLGVTSQADMLLRYFPPVQGRAMRVDAALDPDWPDEAADTP